MKTQVLKKPSFEKLCRDIGLFLSASETQAYLMLPKSKQHDYLSGRYLLKQCFAFMVKDEINMTNVSISYENNKPQIIYKSKTYPCSISHSKKYVACSIDESGHTGIDVEEIRARTTEFQDYILPKDEAVYFSEENGFMSTQAWSIKEASFKADTKQRPLNEYVILGRKGDSFVVENSKTKWQIKVISRVIDNYIVSYTIPNTV